MKISSSLFVMIDVDPTPVLALMNTQNVIATNNLISSFSHTVPIDFFFSPSSSVDQMFNIGFSNEERAFLNLISSKVSSEVTVLKKILLEFERANLFQATNSLLELRNKFNSDCFVSPGFFSEVHSSSIFFTNLKTFFNLCKEQNWGPVENFYGSKFKIEQECQFRLLFLQEMINLMEHKILVLKALEINLYVYQAYTLIYSSDFLGQQLEICVTNLKIFRFQVNFIKLFLNFTNQENPDLTGNIKYEISRDEIMRLLVEFSRSLPI